MGQVSRSEQCIKDLSVWPEEGRTRNRVRSRGSAVTTRNKKIPRQDLDEVKMKAPELFSGAFLLFSFSCFSMSYHSLVIFFKWSVYYIAALPGISLPSSCLSYLVYHVFQL